MFLIQDLRIASAAFLVRNLRFFVICLVSVSFLNSTPFAFAQTNTESADPVAVLPDKGLVPENLIAFSSVPGAQTQYAFIADKKRRTLTVWSSSESHQLQLHGAYPMDIGKASGDKTFAGDHRTPEGIYFFQERREGQELNFDLYGKRAFTLDYPNIYDSKLGKTGSGIWLHAVPDTTSLLRGSRGCVVVRNSTIDILSQFISLRSTPLLILDEVRYVKPADVETQRTAILKWLENWKSAWETKNIESYIENYSDDFHALKMNKSKWRSYKTSLNQRYSTIKVDVKHPLVVKRNDQLMISFIQDYNSDTLKDIGEKTLYLKNEPTSTPKILTELWRPLRPELLALRKSAEEAKQN